jgi:hypothetical protein
MNKKVATLFFILGGTILNLLLMFTFIIGLIAGVSALLDLFSVDPGSQIRTPFLIGSIFGGLVLAFVTYSKIMALIQKKFKLEDYFEPLFKSRRKW